MTPERLAYLIDQYKKDTCTPEERKELDAWYRAFDDEAAGFEISDLSDPGVMNGLKNTLLEGIHAGISPEEAPSRERRATGLRWWRTIAAAVAVILGVTAFFLRGLLEGPEADRVTVATDTLQNSRIALTDGSIIWIKPGSRVQYSKDFDKSAIREVFLEGEAFFDVARDEAKPFVVRTRELNIQVLGTTFNVRSYAADLSVETTLITGRVSIEKVDGASEPVILAPNQQAVYSKADKAVAISTLNLPAATGGKEAEARSVRMVFDESPFSEVLSRMEEKFGIRIFMDDRHRQSCPFTAELEKENLVEILNILKLAYGIDYSLYRDELFIRGQVCNQ